MAKHRIYFQTVASTSIEIEVPDEVTDPDDIVNAAHEQNIDFPTLCHQCSGGRYTLELELGDEWEPAAKENGEPLVEKID